MFLDDRIEVESPGILLPGMTIEEMKQLTSRILNAVISCVFKELNLIEHRGTGVRRIFSEAKELGLPEPVIEKVGMRLRFTVRFEKPHRIEAGAQRHKSGVDSKMTVQVLSVMKEGALPKSG